MPKPSRYPNHRRRAPPPPAAKSFKLLMLPREIRDEIFSWALPRNKGPMRPRCHSQNSKKIDWLAEDDFPLCRWEYGSLELLRVSKQVHKEAAEILWKKNTFDVRFDDKGPRLEIQYFVDEQLRGPHKVSQELRNVRPVYIRLIHGWCLSFPNHYRLGNARQCTLEKELLNQYRRGLPIRFDRNDPVNPLREAHILHGYFQERCLAESENRQKYRQRVFASVVDWLKIVGPKPTFNHLELSFFPYFDLTRDCSTGSDFKLAGGVLDLMDDLSSSITRINGQ